LIFYDSIQPLIRIISQNIFWQLSPSFSLDDTDVQTLAGVQTLVWTVPAMPFS